MLYSCPGNFYPRSPCGERQPEIHQSPDESHYFYPRSPCGERQAVSKYMMKYINISIHALLAESDGMVLEVGFVYYISIHALLAESDSEWCWKLDLFIIFLSTLSLRRATLRTRNTPSQNPFLSTLSLRRATCSCTVHSRQNQISIHALLAESDIRSDRANFTGKAFLSTLSLRRATVHQSDGHNDYAISIHALLAESDDGLFFIVGRNGISIHALLAESDPPSITPTASRRYFYPRSPCGERRY